MEEILLEEYLKNKDRKMSDQNFIKRMKDSYMRNPRRMEKENWDDYSYRNKGSIMSRLDDMSTEDKINLLYMLDNREDDSHYAKEIVSDMYHIAGNKKYIGERFDMHKAKEVYDTYRHKLHNYSVEDVYIAINAQYHDYCALFKQWFGDNIDHKIIESAIVFWFEDIDYQGGNKVHKYFMEF
jgi:hypothetical protein